MITARTEFKRSHGPLDRSGIPVAPTTDSDDSCLQRMALLSIVGELAKLEHTFH